MQNMQKRTIPIWEIITVSGIILLAGLLRTLWPGITEFKADEARLLTLAFDMAEFKAFPIRGISSSVGLPNFPASVWVYALPLFVWKHIYSATIFTGLLNTGAVALCYFFTRRYVGRTAAIVATLMFAVSPWAVIHSRKIWAQNLLPFFVMTWAFSAALAFIDGAKQEKYRKWLILHIAVGVFAAQIHLAAVSLLVASAIFLVIFWRQVVWRWLLSGCAVAMLTLTPFIVYITTQSSGIIPGTAESSGPNGRALSFSWEPFVHVIRLTTGWQFHALTGPEKFQTFLSQFPPLGWLFGVWGLICLAGLIAIFQNTQFKRVKKNAPPPILDNLKPAICNILLVWCLVPILTFLWFPIEVELHYLIPIYPAFYIVAGIAIEYLTEGNWRKLFVAGITLTAGLQAMVVISLISFIGLIDTPGGFGTPVSMHLADITRIKSWLEVTNGQEVLVVSDGTDPLRDTDAAIYDLHLRHIPHRFVNGNHTAVFPAENSVVLITDTNFLVTKLYASQASNLVRTTRRGSNRGLILTLTGDSAPSPDSRFDPVYLLANFVNIQGINWPDENGRFQITWKTGEAYQADYHLTGQLFSANNGRIGQTDIPAFPPEQWQPNDIVVSVFEPQPTTDLETIDHLVFGMYVFPSGEAVPILDAAANPAGDFVELPLDISQE
jgi:4-amino-4-deoxy-L-arabinose transferase-like glycosyltransferase